MKYLSIVAFVMVALTSCNSGSASKGGEAQTLSSSEENACDCIEILLNTLDSVNTIEEYNNMGLAIVNTAPSCLEIMITPSPENQQFVMNNCVELVDSVKIELRKKEEMLSLDSEGFDVAVDSTVSDSMYLEGAVSDTVSSEEE